MHYSRFQQKHLDSIFQRTDLPTLYIQAQLLQKILLLKFRYRVRNDFVDWLGIGIGTVRDAKKLGSEMDFR